MGIGPIAFSLYHDLMKRALLKRGQSVLELGSQDLYSPECAGMLRPLFEEWQVDTDQCEQIARSQDVEAFYIALGFDGFLCIDTDGKHRALRYDLNDPVQLGVMFDVVTNHGTTEHVFNQYNCFKIMHDHCKPGGLMIHCVPMHGYVGHCFFNYQPELFNSLATDNNYDVLGIWLAPDDCQTMKLTPWDGQVPNDMKNGNVLLSVVLRRTRFGPFRAPFQGFYSVPTDLPTAQPVAPPSAFVPTGEPVGHAPTVEVGPAA